MLPRCGSFRSGGIFQREHEGERCKRPNPFDLPQELSFWVVLLADGFQLTITVADALAQRADRLKDGPKGRPECFRDVLRRFLMEAPHRALGQPGPKGLDCSTDVVDQLRAATD